METPGVVDAFLDPRDAGRRLQSDQWAKAGFDPASSYMDKGRRVTGLPFCCSSECALRFDERLVLGQLLLLGVPTALNGSSKRGRPRDSEP